MKSLISILPVVALLVGCSVESPVDDVASSEAPLTASQCATPTVTTVPKLDAQNRPIEGTAKTTLDGCIVGHPGEDGASVIARATLLLGDNAKLAQITDQQNAPLFTRFQPVGPATGSLANGQVQHVDITLAADQSPKGQIRMTRKANADGTYSLAILNNKAITASVLFFTVDVIETGNLTIDLELEPAENGITVRGTSEVELEQSPEQAAESSTMVRDMFAWLTKELAR